MSFQPICSKCRKPIVTILKPCPNCGYQHPLTKAGYKFAYENLLKENQLRKQKLLDILGKLKKLQSWDFKHIEGFLLQFGLTIKEFEEALK